MKKNIPKWLEWTGRLQEIAQAGLAYTDSEYDKERFVQIRKLSAEIINTYTELDEKEIINVFDKEKGYPTPKIDVRALIIRNNKILFVKEKIDGLWTLPGGWADKSLSLRQNVIKETEEEAGIKVEPQKLIAIFDRNKYNRPPIIFGVYKIFILCDYISGKFQKNIETSESSYFGINELPQLSESKVTKVQLEKCIRIIKNNSEPEFD